MKVSFIHDYSHYWPSRAITHFRAGWSGTVKREVGEAAVSKGKAKEVRSRGKHAGGSELLAQQNHGHDAAPSPGRDAGIGGGNGNDDGGDQNGSLTAGDDE